MVKAKPEPSVSPDSSPVLPRIQTVRKQRVVLDADIAKLYEVPTFRINEAIKRNAGRFPADFRFQLTREEVANLIAQIAISSSGHGGLLTWPWAFTEHGCLMGATVLRIEKAVQMSLSLVLSLVQMHDQISSNLGVLRPLAEIDKSSSNTTPSSAKSSNASARSSTLHPRTTPRNPKSATTAATAKTPAHRPRYPSVIRPQSSGIRP